jgi:hypothetical protein
VLTRPTPCYRLRARPVDNSADIRGPPGPLAGRVKRPRRSSTCAGASHPRGLPEMHPDRTRSPDPAGLKRCSACGEEKRAADFYVSRGRLSSYCKDCQRQASRLAYRRRRQDPAARARMRSIDRLRKRQERARLVQLDPDRERRAGRTPFTTTRMPTSAPGAATTACTPRLPQPGSPRKPTPAEPRPSSSGASTASRTTDGS